MKPLSADIPFPSIDELQPDTTAGKIISFAFATPKGELSAILQYVYHSLHLAPLHEEYAETMTAIALSEMHHLKVLGATMLKLGVNPRYVQYPNSDCYFDTSCISQCTTPQKMIMDDIQGELTAITEYKKMLYVLKNENVAAVIQRIIIDEQLHLETLKNMLIKLNG